MGGGVYIAERRWKEKKFLLKTRGRHPFFLHAHLGSNSLVRKKLRMGAKTVGSLSMKICRRGVWAKKSGTQWPRGESCSSKGQATPFSAPDLLTAPVSSLSVEMRPLSRLWGTGGAWCQGCVCTRVQDVRVFVSGLRSFPDLPRPSPNQFWGSPGEEGIWDPGESLARGAEPGRGE